MKRLLLLICLYGINSQAQTYKYTPFLTTTDWQVLLADLGGTDTFWYHQAFKIKENMVEYTAITDCDGLDPIVYIRENTVSRKVYYMRPDEMIEHLLFDFSVKVGDIVNVPLALLESQSMEFKVISIDTIVLPDGKHKRFVYKENQNLMRRQFTLVEGIGCLAEPFKIFYKTDDPTFYLMNTFIGLKHNYKFMDTGKVNICYTPSRIRSQKTIQIKAYPNPCNEVLNLDNTDSLNYKIYNSTGQLVAFGRCLNEIRVSDLSEGLYTLWLGDADRMNRIVFIKN